MNISIMSSRVIAVIATFALVFAYTFAPLISSLAYASEQPISEEVSSDVTASADESVLAGEEVNDETTPAEEEVAPADESVNDEAPATAEEETVSDEETTPAEETTVESTSVAETTDEQASDKDSTNVDTREEVVEDSTPVESAFASVADVPLTPELSTDKADYLPGETATIFGKFFAALQSISLKIFGTDENGGQYSESTQHVTADEGGSFMTTYTLDNVYRPLYTVVASDAGSGEQLAQTMFTDAPAKIKLEQCHNFDGAYVNCTDLTGPTNYWGTGNAQSSNAQLNEGDSQNYRIIITDLPTTGIPSGGWTLVIEQDLTKGGKMAQDFWTGPGNIKTADDSTAPFVGGIYPCIDNGSANAFCTPPAVNAIAIPSLATTTSQPAGFAAVVSAQAAFASSTNTINPPLGMHIYGGTGQIVGYSFSGNFATGDSSIRATIRIQNSSSNVVIAYGGHISRSSDYAPTKQTATGITGSPYHNRLISFDGINGDTGNQDMQMASTAIVTPPGSITIIKDADPNNAQDFSFTATGGLSPSPFILDDDADGTLSNTQVFSTIASGTATTITETPVAGWTLGSPISCTGASVSTISQVTNGVSIVLRGGENITCTFVNTLQQGTIELKKVWSGTAGQTTLQIGTSAGGSQVDSQLTGANGAAPLTTGQNSVNSGTYYMSETGGLTNYTTAPLSCFNDANDNGTDDGESSVTVGANDSVPVAAGQHVICTYTNTRQHGKIQLLKDFVGTPESVTIKIGTSQGGAQVESKVLAADGGTNEHTVDTGTFYVSETLTNPGNYTSSLSCYNDVNDNDAVDGGDTAHTVNTGTGEVSVGNNEDVLCVYTNTRNTGTVELRKVWNGTAGQTTLNIGTSAGGSQIDSQLTGANGAAPLTTGQNTVDTPATVYVSEVGGLTNYDSSLSCYNDANNNGTNDGESAVVAGGDGSISVTSGQHVICIYTNTRHQGSIELQKHWIGTTSSTTLKIGTSAGGSQVDSEAVNGSDGTTGANIVDTGTYYVNETDPGGNYQTTLACSDQDGEVTVGADNTVVVEKDDAVVCVFTNEEILALAVEKTATTTYTRTFGWTINKSVTPATWNLFAGDSGTSEYTIAVTKDEGTDSNWAVGGTITITNPNTNVSFDATITSVSDVLDDAGAAAVDCGVTFPYVLQEGAQLVCTYVKTGASTEDTLNTATVATTGLVPGGQGTAAVIFGSPTTLVNNTIDVDDTYAGGDKNDISDDDSYTYTRQFSCGADEGIHNNTATIVQTEQNDSASVTVHCYALEVSKDASTSLDRTYDWSIEKSVDKATLTLSPGQIFPVNYEVTVTNTGSTDSNWVVGGTITVHNPAPIDAVITGVSDAITGVGPVPVDCGATVFPYTLVAGGDLVCTYSSALGDANSRTNHATSTLQNYDYDKDGDGTADGTTEWSGSASVSFAGATVQEIDGCVEVNDTNPNGPQNEIVCSGDSPKTFNYSVDIGPYEQTACGTTVDVDNTATFGTNDTETIGSDDATVAVTIACVCSLTQGYWKTHNDLFKGGAPSDDNWLNVPDSADDGNTTQDGPNERFYKSGQSWFQVFWTAPKGNSYYNLAHQYMAAKLNVLNGAFAPVTVANAIVAAEVLFNAYTPEQIAALKGNNALRKQFVDLAGILGAFNEGLTNPAGHCSEIPA